MRRAPASSSRAARHMERLAEVDTVDLRQDRHADAGPSGGRRRHQLTNESITASASAGARGGGGNAASSIRSPKRCAARPREFGANVPVCDETQYRIGLGVEGQVNGYYRACRQRALHAPKRHQGRRGREPTARRSKRRAIPAFTSRRTERLPGSCPMPIKSGRKAGEHRRAAACAGRQGQPSCSPATTPWSPARSASGSV